MNIMLLSGQRLELTCDTKTICKDVFDMVVAHIGLVEHHLFALAILKGNCLSNSEFRMESWHRDDLLHLIVLGIIWGKTN